MKPTKEICKNCQHQCQAMNEPRNHRYCFVWDRITFVNDTCQHFEISERLLPTLKDVQAFWNPSPQ